MTKGSRQKTAAERGAAINQLFREYFPMSELGRIESGESYGYDLEEVCISLLGMGRGDPTSMKAVLVELDVDEKYLFEGETEDGTGFWRISEPAIYLLMFRSDHPRAVRFRERLWGELPEGLMSEVIAADAYDLFGGPIMIVPTTTTTKSGGAR